MPRSHRVTGYSAPTGSPRPVTIIDFAWPERKVAVFCDGWENHHTTERRAADKTKRDALQADALDRAVVLGGQIVRDPAGCAREILDHLSTAETAHYNRHRPHRARNLRPPDCDDITMTMTTDLTTARIRRRKVLGGLIHEHERAA